MHFLKNPWNKRCNGEMVVFFYFFPFFLLFFRITATEAYTESSAESIVKAEVGAQSISR